jgi:hypothetical protein
MEIPQSIGQRASAYARPIRGRTILQGRQPVEITATRLTELDLPLDWTEQRRLLAS